MTTQPLYLDEFCTSFAQQRLWFLEQYEQGTSRYHMPVACRVKGELDEVALEAALNDLVERHEVLRTTFAAGPEGPVQRIAEQLHITLAREGLAGADEARVQARIRQEAQAPFDLAQGPLLRATVLRLSADERIVLLTLHHITSDGWSMAVLLRELGACYRARLQGAEPALPELAIQYADYAVWQREWLQGEVLQRQLDHWRRTLQGAPAVLELPTDHPRPAQPRRPGAVVHFQLDAALAGRLQRLGQPQQASLFMTLAAALNVLLHRYSQQDDLCIGYPVANRQRAEVEGLIGFFVNTLVLRTRIRPGDDFHTLLRQVREAVLEADAHQDLPFEKLVEELKPQRSLNQTPLFQVMLAFYNADHAAQLDLPGLSTQVLDPVERTAKFDLSFEISLQHGQLQAGVEYDSELYERASIERLAAHYRRVLELVAETPECPVGQLPLLSEAEHNQQLVTWNATRTAYPEAHEALHQLVERQAQRSPQAVALVHEGGEISYEALNRRANQLAHHLRAQGIGADTRVAVCLQRSPEMVVALLGILKAGAAYVPLDPAHPRQRLAYMLADTASPLLITQQGLLDHLAPLDVPVLCLDRDAALLDAQAEHDPQHPVHPDQLAYCIYTSGSTGQPKGAMNSHRAIVNRLLWMQAQYRLDTSDTVLQKTPYTFDVSVWEFFWPLMTGARLAIAPSEAHKDPQQLAHTLRQHRVTTAHFVPAMLQAFLAQSQAALPALRRVFASGEALPATVQRQFRQRHPQVELHNLYGPTEAAVDVSHWACTDDSDPVPIGRPVANTRLYVLDAQLQPVPVGVTAELYIAGVQLARGYLGRPELTAERFLPDPHGEPGSRMYRTGDLARYRADGSIEYHGRTDHQVKLRGLRIELGEIENTLLGLPGVREAVVLAREEPGGTRLVGYVALHDPDEPGVEARLQQQLLAQLPEYMVPASWVVLSALPLNANGKIDRKALPEPQDRAAGQAHVEPESDTQRLLAGLWRELLHTERVGLHDNFFALGGHSLMATQLVSRLREARGIELPLRAVFEAPVLAQLAARVDDALAQPREASHPVIPRALRTSAPLASFAQQRLWFLEQYEQGTSRYHMPVACRVKGELDEVALEAALNDLVERHEVLRTTFAAGPEGPVQRIAEQLHITLAREGLAGADEARVQARIRQEAQAPFDLAQGPLLRATVLRLSADERIVLLTLHHITSDGWSMAVLLRELGACYRARLQGAEPALPELAIQYADYAVWQREWLQGEVLQRQLDHWRRTLQGAPAVLELPTDHPRPAQPRRPGAVVHFQLDAALAGRLQRLGQPQQASLFMTLAAALNVLLHRYSQQDDLCIGYPVANRQRAEVEGLIGFFVNTLVLRTRIRPGDDFHTLLRQVREAVLEADAHQDLPFEKLVEELKPQRSLNQTPLFQVMLAFYNADHAAQLDLPGLSTQVLDPVERTAKFDLSFEISLQHGQLQAGVEYDSELYERASIERLAAHYRRVLELVAETPECPVGQLPLLSEAEHNQQLVTWNATRTAYPEAHEALHQLVERQAQRSPQAVALVHEGGEISYEALNRRANQLAHHLRAQGIGADTRVAVCLQRSPEMVVALLGILKAGAAYVPLDPAHPRQRLAYMLADTASPLLITQQGLLDHLAPLDVPVLCLDRDAALLDAQAEHDPQHPVHPDQLAYCIYTSGSTGQPKGAMNSHRAIVNRLLWMQAQYRLDTSDTVLQKTPYTFDVSVWEFFWPLMTGARLAIAPSEAHKDPQQLAHTLRQHRVTTAHFVPAMLQAFLAQSQAALPALRRVFASGEALPATVQRQFRQRHPQVELHNLYGPTEAAVDVSHWACTDDSDPVPIGRPVANTRLYVLDAQLQPVPVGVTAELYIAGVQLARGYLGRPELTAERFLPDPHGEPGSRMYRTGDLARYRADGSIEYHGRTDHQVKLRGLRIELGEIENTLLGLPGVREAVVLAREEPGGTRLVGYVALHDPDEPGVEARLQQQLLAQLPEYMVPASWVVLSALPLNANGKIDRKALPEPQDRAAGQAHVEPESDTQRLLAGLWRELLHTERVGLHDNFFALGGHSLMATQLVSRLREARGIELPLRAVFEAPVLAQLAARVEAEQAAATRNDAIASHGAAPGEHPLSFAQERLFFLDQLEPGSAAYNIPMALRLRGALDAPALERALDTVVRRHAALRTSFAHDAAGHVVAVVHAEPLAPLQFADLSAFADAEGAMRLQAAEASSAPFDLQRGPLLRTRLLRLRADEHVLLLTLHHVVADAWSIGVLVREVLALYAAFSAGQASPLSDLPIQYPDFARWQREWLSGERLQAQTAFWTTTLAGAPATLELPTDRPRPALQTFAGATLERGLGRALSAQIDALAQAHGTTPFMTLLAAFNVLLARHAQQDDIVVGSPVANRTRRETEPLIGFFVNTLALRTQLDGNPRFSDLLDRVRQSTLAAYAHQDLPFEHVVDALKLPRDLGRSPLFQVMFTLKNTDMPAFDIAGLTAEPVPVESGAARFDLMLELSPGPRGYVGHWEYNRDLFDAATIERMAGHFEVLLAAATAAPDTRIAALPLMTAAERRQVLGTWNATAQPFRQVPVHELFRETAQRHPDLLAAISAEGALSYDQLNRRSNQLARYLRRLGVRPHSLVGLCLERSLDVAVAVLGILKAGAACVPMDASYPVERLRFMARDAGAPVIVTQTPLRDRVGDCDAAFICMDACDEAWREADTDEPHDLPLLALCYVIYTSGSTGQPKGAALTHEMLTNLAQWQLTESALGVGDRTLQFSPLSFDVSFDEMVSTWAAAGTLVMVSEETRRDPVQLLHLVMRERVARLFIPFVALQGIADAARELPHPGALREIVCGGEQLQVTDEVVAMYRKIPGGLLHNQYGPTESHFVTGHRLEDEPGDWPRLPPIGKPLFNCRMYVLDAQLEPVPAGVRGDLYIAGLHLARGYWKRPDMTAERFVPDPFAPTPGERMYRTGDVARYLPDGSIEYLGRTDHQVKIRGFRIELAEVEQALMAFDSVAAGAATVREDRPGVKKLVGYVVAKPGASADLRALRDWLAARLPDYMVPSALVALPALPQTPSGKIDRRALPAPADDEAAQARHVAPEGALEEAIARIWSDVLGVPRVGALDGFFELGGHSLLATRVVSRLRIELGLTLPLRLLFEAPTVRQLAQALSTQPAAAASPAAGPAAGGTALASALTPDRTWPEGSPWPLSYAQQRLWFIEQLAPGLPTYNVPLALRLQGPLDAAALQRALDAIAARHLLLGARVRPGSAEPLFEQRGQGAWPCITEVLAAGPEQEARLRQRLADEARRSFDLATGPLVRAHLFVLSADTRVLLLNMLHIVTDGWSIGVLARELQALYGAFAQGQPDPLPALPLQYRDYATWQRRQSGRLSDSLAWWKSELDGLPVVHALPLDRPRPTALGTEGATVLHWLPRATQQGLEALCHQRSASLFMGLHALLATLIARYSGQDDIAIGTPVANRDDAELAPLIGLFVNTVVLRTRLGAAASFDECLAHSRNTALQAFSHQQVPFEHVVDALQPERSLSHAPLFQVMLALQNNDHAVPELPGLRTTLEPVGDTTARFDLTINAVPGRDGLALHWEYNTALFDRATVEQMALHFERLADAAIAQPQVPVAHLPLLKAAERAAEVHPAGRMLADYPVPHCLHELFEQQVARRPDAVAVSCGSQSWTYRELDERANRLARHLVERGVGPDTLVGLCMGRSLAMIEGLLAILKAGGAYVPLDPQYPPARLHYMLGNSAVRVLLTQTEWRESLTLPDSIEALCLDDEAHRAGFARLATFAPGLRDLHLGLDRPTQGRAHRAPPGGALAERYAGVVRLRPPRGVDGVPLARLRLLGVGDLGCARAGWPGGDRAARGGAVAAALPTVARVRAGDGAQPDAHRLPWPGGRGGAA
jgi:amino acid adenylation domain-containing protein